MDKSIDTLLDEMEHQHGCRVLFAVESGSRAWGFASPDSDYDVRFVYAHPLDWYLRLEQFPDTIERYFPGDVDCVGWDVRKALRLFAGCNLALFEWLGSPVVYRENGALLEGMRQQVANYFNPQKAMHHYLGMARNIYENHLDGDNINIKKLFYILHPLVATAWIADRQTMPPVPFPELLDAGLLPDPLQAEIQTKLEQKLEAREESRTRISPDLRQWIDRAFATYHETAHQTTPGETPGWEPLNTLFRDAIGAPADLK